MERCAARPCVRRPRDNFDEFAAPALLEAQLLRSLDRCTLRTASSSTALVRSPAGSCWRQAPPRPGRTLPRRRSESSRLPPLPPVPHGHSRQSRPPDAERDRRFGLVPVRRVSSQLHGARRPRPRKRGKGGGQDVVISGLAGTSLCFGLVHRKRFAGSGARWLRMYQPCLLEIGQEAYKCIRSSAVPRSVQ